MSKMIIRTVFVSLVVMCVLATIPAVAAVGSTPAVAQARMVYENSQRDAISSGLIKLLKFEKTDGQSGEVLGVKTYRMYVDAVLYFPENAYVCAMPNEGRMNFSAGKYDRRKVSSCLVNKNIIAGGRLVITGIVDFHRTENEWKVGGGSFQVSDLDVALEKAILESDLTAVKTLIARGVGGNAECSDPSSPYWSEPLLFMAVSLYQELDAKGKKNSLAIMKSLLDAGADVNAKGGTGSVLGVAIQVGPEVVKLLINKGVDVNLSGIFGKYDNEGHTALMLVATGNAYKNTDAEIAKMLLAKGANVNATNTFGSTALMMAASENNAEVVQILLAKGADINARNNEGETALSIAVAKGNAGIASMLQKKN